MHLLKPTTPHRIKSILYQAGRETLIKLERRVFELAQRQAQPIMSAEWSNLILLDGCRYDMFVEANPFDARVDRRLSKGSSTHDFLEGNFRGTSHPDTVYVTANPIYRIDSIDVDCRDVFHAVVDVWEDAWDDELGTVPPAAMARATRKAYENFPNKRLIAHFIQPHHPFIGETGHEIDDIGMRGPQLLDNSEKNDPAQKVWHRLTEGDISSELVWKAYRENLQAVLPHIEDLIDLFEGTTVVTSDHGNLVDEIAFPWPVRMSGHPRAIYTPKLMHVPWVQIEGRTSKRIVSEEVATSRTSTSTATIEERLSALGYRE